MPENHSKAWCTEKLEFSEREVQQLKARYMRFALWRLLAFVGALAALYALFGWWIWFTLTLIASGFGFLYLMAYSEEARQALRKGELRVKLLKMELSGLDSRRFDFDHGADFLDKKHPYAYDMDLFAPFGVFAFFNRTVTSGGRKRLAQILLQGSSNAVANQDTIEKLSLIPDWMLDFRVAGSLIEQDADHDLPLTSFFAADFNLSKRIIWGIWLIPIFSLSAVIMNYFGVISTSVLGIILVAVFGFISQELKKTNRISGVLGRYQGRFQSMLNQLILIRQEASLKTHQWSDLNLAQIEASLQQILRIQQRFDLRLNIVVSPLLNLFLAWDFRCRKALHTWSGRDKEELLKLEAHLFELEALISAATARFNYRTTTCYAEKSDHGITSHELSHPLLTEDESVGNEVRFDADLHFIILTGPNMAGKSTFLRSLGLALIASRAGFPIFASRFQCLEFNLFTSMRTADDITSHSSFFYAELSRLKQLTEMTQDGKATFVLLDEILKGTNSKDKEIGSRLFLLKLSRMGIKGVIATHDLSLCELADEQAVFRNFYFDSTISGDHLSFDYLMKPGICQNMNASFLLKKMNLID